jgi:hypothetical protein
VQLGNNFMLFNTFEIVPFFGNTVHPYKTLFMRDPKDDRCIFMYIKSDQKSEVYKYTGILIRETK